MANAPGPIPDGAAASWASSPAARAVMVANRGRDTSLEMAVRSRVHARGLRYRVDHRPLGQLRRTADLLFTRRRVAVLLDGCFWHGCPEHHRAPRSNAAFWASKIERNIERDRDTDHQWRQAGWTVLRYWEHQDPDDIADDIAAHVRSAAPRRS